jgi:lysophospholipase L1-like esterase
VSISTFLSLLFVFHVQGLPGVPKPAPERLSIRQDDDESGPINPDTVDLSYIRNFAAVGDSYAAGLGAGVRDDAACSRYYDAYPRLINRDARLGLSRLRNFQFAACSGHTSSQVTNLQIPGLDGNVDVLTISAGGNDVGLTNVLNDCIYGWLAPPQEKCNQTIETTESLIHNDLPSSLDSMLLAARRKLRPRIGRIYYVSYAKFFGEDDPQCDSVSWSWYQSQLNDDEKLYLTQDKRRKLNQLVELANTEIKAAVERAGAQVVYLDINQYYEIWGGRFCETGVVEPAPDSDILLFFERYTGEGDFPFRIKVRREDTALEPVSSSNGTFEAQVNEYVQQTLQKHPDWITDLKTDAYYESPINELSSRQASLILPDSWLRVFHPRPNGHAIIAMYTLYHMEREMAKLLNLPIVSEEQPIIDTCPFDLDNPSLRPGCASNSASSVPQNISTPDGEASWDPNGLIIALRQGSCTNECSIPPEIPSEMAVVYQDDNKQECEISVALPDNVEAWVYRGTPSVGDHWQDCWDSFINITAQCVQQGPNNGWVNGPDPYEYFVSLCGVGLRLIANSV